MVFFRDGRDFKLEMKGAFPHKLEEEWSSPAGQRAVKWRNSCFFETNSWKSCQLPLVGSAETRHFSHVNANSQSQEQFPALLVRLFVVCETVLPHYWSVFSVLLNSDHIKLKNVWWSSWISFCKHVNQDAPAPGCADKWCSCCPQKQKSRFWRGQIDFLTRLDGILLQFLFQFSPKADNEQQRGEKLLLRGLI